MYWPNHQICVYSHSNSGKIDPIQHNLIKHLKISGWLVFSHHLFVLIYILVSLKKSTTEIYEMQNLVHSNHWPRYKRGEKLRRWAKRPCFAHTGCVGAWNPVCMYRFANCFLVKIHCNWDIFWHLRLRWFLRKTIDTTSFESLPESGVYWGFEKFASELWDHIPHWPMTIDLVKVDTIDAQTKK